ncbi:MAG: phage tail protein [Pyrinomonadaceae bacterium MAG19_C2-C3]|nr:phage tail protein [Pyrinomonadaceae bacterium MAG19_C2-C3]
MKFSNLNYFLDHLPARYMRGAAGEFLTRFLLFFGTVLDEWDAKFEDFYKELNPQTCSEDFLRFWLAALFGWTWFPAWFDGTRKREFYRYAAAYFARRGTVRGMREMSALFGIEAEVHARPIWFAEAAFDDSLWAITDALGVVVHINALRDEVTTESGAWGELAGGEAYGAPVRPTLTNSEIDALLAFEQPHGQELLIVEPRHPYSPLPRPVFPTDLASPENSSLIIPLL